MLSIAELNIMTKNSMGEEKDYFILLVIIYHEGKSSEQDLNAGPWSQKLNQVPGNMAQELRALMLVFQRT